MSNVSEIKPHVTPVMVLPVLQEYFGGSIRNLQLIPGGNVAQTFSFTTEPGYAKAHPDARVARDYIVQFNATMLVNFEKEAYACENFASPAIPIPRVVHVAA